MNLIPFETQHIEEARETAAANYYEEQQFIQELPHLTMGKWWGSYVGTNRGLRRLTLQ